MSFKSEGEIKIFPDKQKMRVFVTTRPALQEMFKGVLQGEIKGHETVNSKLYEELKTSIKVNT